MTGRKGGRTERALLGASHRLEDRFGERLRVTEHGRVIPIQMDRVGEPLRHGLLIGGFDCAVVGAGDVGDGELLPEGRFARRRPVDEGRAELIEGCFGPCNRSNLQRIDATRADYSP